MKLGLLDQRRPDVDVDELADHCALYAGGRAWWERRARFLPQRPQEDDVTYRYRQAHAHYLNYAGAIVDYFASYVFTGKMKFEGAAAWFTDFKEDCDRTGTDLDVFLRERLRRALIEKRSWTLVDFPASAGSVIESRADWESQNLGQAYLCALSAFDVLDWEHDDAGQLDWVIVKDRDERRVDPTRGRDVVTDTWTIWRKDTWERYAVTYKRTEPPKADDDIALVASGMVATPGRVPIVCLEVPDGLWLMNRLFSPQVEHLRARNALSYSLARTCFAQRIFKMHENPSEQPRQGPGYGLCIGFDEDVIWDSPPADAFKPVAEYIAELKDEIYRVGAQMALGVTNNAAALGRSGDSKAEDNKATDIVAKSYGGLVCEASERILDLVSRGRGETVAWAVTGMDVFADLEAKPIVESAVQLETLGIASPTLRREVQKRVARAMLPNVDLEVLATIDAELDAAPTEPAEPATPPLDEPVP